MYDDADHGSFAGEVGNNSVEFVESEAFVGGSLLVNAGAVHHLQNVVIIDAFLQVFANIFEFLEVNHSVLVLVEHLEGGASEVFGPIPGLVHGRHQELRVVNSTVSVGVNLLEHTLDLVVVDRGTEVLVVALFDLVHG